MLYRKGDRVSVEGVVKYDQQRHGGEDYVHVRLPDYIDVMAKVDNVTLVARRFDVGDVIAWSDVRGTHRVEAIGDGYLWIKNIETNSYWTAEAKDCELAPITAPGGTASSAPADPTGFAALDELIEPVPDPALAAFADGHVRTLDSDKF